MSFYNQENLIISFISSRGKLFVFTILATVKAHAMICRFAVGTLIVWTTWDAIILVASTGIGKLDPAQGTRIWALSLLAVAIKAALQVEANALRLVAGISLIGIQLLFRNIDTKAILLTESHSVLKARGMNLNVETALRVLP